MILTFILVVMWLATGIANFVQFKHNDKISWTQYWLLYGTALMLLFSYATRVMK